MNNLSGANCRQRGGHTPRVYSRSISRKMHPYVTEISRTNTTRNQSLSVYHEVPSTKLKNVVCVFCKKKFYLPDLSNLNLNGSISKGTLIPLLLKCGHPVCSKCANTTNIKKCPSCDKILQDNGQKSLLPLNLYALGLIVSSHNRPLENDDEDFKFCHKLSTQLRQIARQGCCHECGNQAHVNCPQCMALYCHCCYSKIHGRALQSHTQIPINNGDSNPGSILNSCSSTCSEQLSYFCNDCNVACCSNCTLCLHKLHDYVALSEKNEMLMFEFNKVYNCIEETLQRVHKTKEVTRVIPIHVH
ncbi:uncharacterized protein LOC105429841 isoform X2 [Pogonomyrmex barbatus]|uniref:Uncharacterized protein LOC105429841 isoform X2 n=1 Tax=Pogonomyrmex barbatus TaxID=144034 RepID=A0A6I9WFL2_9HYME|nr:uncharacterized protein LOC105429841 isoform X2 [Pogonomyrmex barbatus]